MAKVHIIKSPGPDLAIYTDGIQPTCPPYRKF